VLSSSVFIDEQTRQAINNRGTESIAERSLLIDPEDRYSMFIRNVKKTSAELYGVTSQEIVLFMVTAVRTVNPTQNPHYLNMCLFLLSAEPLADWS
jgi:hypothetical protein